MAEERLVALQRKGVLSDVLDARLDWSEAEAVARYVRPLQNLSRVKPNVLPTAQSQGRWSTTKPPIITWPDHDDQQCPECTLRREHGIFVAGEWCPRAVREIIIPDPGTWWLKGDAEAIEARIAAGYTRDEEDLAAFKQGWDLHTTTAAGMFGFPLPPVRTKKAIMSGPECEEWRQQVKWGGESDRRRHGCKSFRYAWQYAIDERGVLAVKALHTLGLSKEEILDYARQYKRSKPGFFAGRKVKMETCARNHQARTFLGRLRRLYGKKVDQMKEGWSHMVSGSVADIVNLAFINWTQAFPESWLVVNGYDSLVMGFPETSPPDVVIPRVREIVEKDWEIEGTVVRLPWSWKVVTA